MQWFNTEFKLVRIVSNLRNRDKNEQLNDIQFQTQTIFDKSRNEVHRDVCVELCFSCAKAQLPWTKWANKLASREDLGSLSEFSPGNFPLDVGSLPRISEVIQQSHPPPPAVWCTWICCSLMLLFARKLFLVYYIYWLTIAIVWLSYLLTDATIIVSQRRYLDHALLITISDFLQICRHRWYRTYIALVLLLI